MSRDGAEQSAVPADVEMSVPDAARRLEERHRHALRDLDELADQVAAGELDEPTAARLRAGYEAEIEAVEGQLDAVNQGLRDEPDAEPRGRSPSRAMVGALLLVGAFTVVILVAAQTFRSGGDSSPDAGVEVPAIDGATLEQMEAIIASHPDSPGMRLALADLYFERGAYSSAIDHYLAALEAELTPEEESRALGRIGWMAYATGQLDAAVAYLQAGLAADPDNNEGKLFLGMVLFEGFGDPAGAIPLFEQILELPNLDDEMRGAVEAAVEEARTAVESQ